MVQNGLPRTVDRTKAADVTASHRWQKRVISEQKDRGTVKQINYPGCGTYVAYWKTNIQLTKHMSSTSHFFLFCTLGCTESIVINMYGSMLSGESSLWYLVRAKVHTGRSRTHWVTGAAD